MSMAKKALPLPSGKVKRGNPAWVKGVSANPAGKRKGTIGKFGQTQMLEAVKNGMLPLEFMLIILRADPVQLKSVGILPKLVTLDRRMVAANAAAPYCHRKLPIMPIPEDEKDPDAIARAVVAAVRAMDEATVVPLH